MIIFLFLQETEETEGTALHLQPMDEYFHAGSCTETAVFTFCFQEVLQFHFAFRKLHNSQNFSLKNQRNVFGFRSFDYENGYTETYRTISGSPRNILLYFLIRCSFPT